MATERKHIRELIGKLEALSPERIAEVEDFIDFLKQRSGPALDAGRDKNLRTGIWRGVGQPGRRRL